MKKKLFCDLDGTILDVSKRHYTVYTELMDTYHGKPLEFEEYWDLKRKKMRWPDLLPLSGVNADQLKPFLEDFKAKIEDAEYLKLDTIFPGAVDTLDTLSRAYDTSLVSLRRNTPNLLEQLARLGIRGHFQKVLTGHSEADGWDVKVELIRNELQDNEGIIIGDTEADIVTGKHLGMTTIAVMSGIRDGAFLAELQPDYQLDSINEVPAILQLT